LKLCIIIRIGVTHDTIDEHGSSLHLDTQF